MRIKLSVITILVILFLVGTVGAWNWDNVKSYDEETKTIKIKNALGFGEDIANITLNTPHLVYAIRGEDRKVAEFTINNVKKYEDVFNNIEFYDIENNMKSFERDFTYKYKSSLGKVDVNDYETICIERENKNETKYDDCTRKLTGTHKEERFEWIEIDTSKELPKGKTTIGIFTDVYFGDNVEWVVTLFGVEIDEWAVWTDSLNVGLLAYYTLNETSGNMLDSVGSMDGTVTGATQGASGIIGTSYYFKDGNDVNIGTTMQNFSTTIGISVWIYPNWDVVETYNCIVERGYDSAFTLHRQSNDNWLWWRLWGSSNNNLASGTILNKTWTHVVVTANGSTMNTYLNGTLSTVGAYSGDINDITNDITLGREPSDGFWYGNIDELGIWNRSLSASEVTQLYNSGTGITYAPTIDPSPQFVLNSPVDNYNTTTPTISFNCTPSDNCGITNVSLLINGTVEQTNSSGMNGTQYTFIETVASAGFYNWSCQAYDDVPQLNSSTGRYFTYTNELTVSIDYPIIAYNSTSPTISFNGSASDDTAIVNVSLYTDGKLNQTNSSGMNATEYNFTQTFTDGTHNWTFEACDAVSCTSATTRNFTINTTPDIHFISPTYANVTNLTANNSVFINVTLTETYFYSINFEIYNSNGTLISYNYTNSTRYLNISMPDGSYNYNVSTFTTTGQSNTTGIRNITIDTTPDIHFISPTPTNNTNSTYPYVPVNISLTETFFSNITFNFYNGTITSYFLSNSTRYLNVSLAEDSYTYNATVWTSTGQTNSTITREITLSKYFENLYTYNSTSFETKTEQFTLNITARETPTAAKLIYNGTTYSSATVTSIGGHYYNLSRTLDVPITIENKSFHFNFTVSGTEYNTTPQNQTISSLNFSLCGSTLTTEYLNLSFKDEETDTYINATIDASTWYYWLGSGVVNKTYTFSNTTNHSNYTFCSSATDNSIKLDMNVQYSASGYPQRRYINESTYLNSSMMSTVLYLLSSGDGLSVTFQVLSGAAQPISGVYVEGKRVIGGSSTLVASGTTGNDGGVTFWLNSDYSHTFTFTKTGYDTETLTVTPTQSTYTVTLGGEEVETTTEDYSRGITYSIIPSDLNLNYNTTYNFNFTISSTYWDLDEFGITITNGTITYGTDSDTTGTGGTVSIVLNTTANTTIKMQWYYEIDGNTTRGTKIWWVANFTDYGYGVSTFFTHLRSYTGTAGTTGIFGLNDFSRTLLIFVFIFLFVGTITYTTGIYSPAAVTWLVFVLVALFDVGANMLPTLGITYFPTIITLLVAVGLTLREGMK